VAAGGVTLDSTLRELPLKGAYHKGQDDIASSFYLPCMDRASTYDRAVGFFSSTIYALAWPSLRRFVEHGGRMRIICSPVLSHEDVEALGTGYSARHEELNAARTRAELEAIYETPYLRKPAQVLAALVAEGVVELKIAWVGDEAAGRPRRLFHDKLGVFQDSDGNTVVFKGSMNETWPALSADGNLESVDVFVDWYDERESDRVRTEQEYFEALWRDAYPTVKTVPFPEVAVEFLEDIAEVDRWPEHVDEICLEIERGARWAADRGPGGRTPRPHQVEALERWIDTGRRGIFKHATGSGKTYTALCAIRDSLERSEVPLVIVPSELLLRQWEREIRATFDPLQLLVCGGGDSRWREGGLLRSWTRPSSSDRVPRAVLSTIQSASSEQFLRLVKDGPHLFVVADEVHRCGSAHHRRVLELDSGPRLGLSATPERYGDAEGTHVIFDYFGDVVPPIVTLADAIASGALTPYAYYVGTVDLEEDEAGDWLDLTREIRQTYARLAAGDDSAPTSDPRLKRLLIRRSRVVKKARRKVAMAAETLASHHQPGHRWIVYCDDQEQLREVRSALRHLDLDNVMEYHTAMTGDEDRTLEMFEEQGGIIVAIRCLDEGVDIPAVSHALILASSKNPREFIQRRGRVLRKHGGKHLAYIHDAIVLPPRTAEPEPAATAVLEGELSRALYFGAGAINPASVTHLQRLAIRHGIDWESLQEAGYEDDEDY
jgi:superfamily II DNA or RNA helicase